MKTCISMFRFKDFTTENKIQQKELMAIFNVGQSTVSHLVSGKIPITEDRLNILRERYGSIIIDQYVVPDEANEIIREKTDTPTDAMSIISSLIASNQKKDEELSELRKELAHLTRCFKALAEKHGLSDKSIEKAAG